MTETLRPRSQDLDQDIAAKVSRPIPRPELNKLEFGDLGHEITTLEMAHFALPLDNNSLSLVG